MTEIKESIQDFKLNHEILDRVKRYVDFMSIFCTDWPSIIVDAH